MPENRQKNHTFCERFPCYAARRDPSSNKKLRFVMVDHDSFPPSSPQPQNIRRNITYESPLPLPSSLHKHPSPRHTSSWNAFILLPSIINFRAASLIQHIKTNNVQSPAHWEYVPGISRRGVFGPRPREASRRGTATHCTQWHCWGGNGRQVRRSIARVLDNRGTSCRTPPGRTNRRYYKICVKTHDKIHSTYKR